MRPACITSRCSVKEVVALNTASLVSMLNFDDLCTRMGKIDKVVGSTVEATGPVSNIGDVCRITLTDGREVLSEVVGFNESKVLLMPYEDTEGIGYGSTVVNTGTKLSINVCDEMIGRTIDALGRPIDGGPPHPGPGHPLLGGGRGLQPHGPPPH